MLTALTSIATFTYLVVTGIVVFLKNPKRPLNISLALALLFSSIWLIGVAGLTTALGENVLYGRFIYVAAIAGLGSLYLFVYFFAQLSKTKVKGTLNPKKTKAAIIFLCLVALSPLLLKDVESAGEGKLPDPVLGPAYILFLAWFVFTVTSITILLVKTYKYSHGRQRKQAKTIMFGLCLFVATAAVTNVVIPRITQNTDAAKFAPLSAIILALFLSYAVLKQRFLDIRLIIARSLAYVLLLSTMVAVYALLAFVVTDRLFGSDSAFSQRVVPILVAILLAFTAPLLKKFFDRVTNKIFYQDAYEPQKFLDRLNKILVGNIEMGILLRRTSCVMEEHLKCTFCVVGVREGEGSKLRFIGHSVTNFKLEETSYVQEQLQKIDKTVILTEELESVAPKLRSVLEEHGVALVVGLRSGYEDYQNTNIAYMMLGPKKSGNIYNKQDLQIIEIIAGEMVIAIQNALRFEEIEQFNATLQSRVNQATAKLKQTNEKLKELDETKDEFLSMASHQLRTPLTSVKGYLSMVLDGDVGKISDDQRKLLEQAFVSSQRMVYLIADLLNVSRLKTGKFVIESVPTNLADIVQSEIAQLKEVARAKNLKLSYTKPRNFPSLLLDETKTRQVIMNFADNAIYYTPSGGHINIELKTDKSNVYFTVTDNGLGVPRSEQPHLFTKFFRAQNARQVRPDGTGLGLFMAKKVVSAQGGSIIFESKESAGSTFGFTFPLSKTLG